MPCGLLNNSKAVGWGQVVLAYRPGSAVPARSRASPCLGAPPWSLCVCVCLPEARGNSFSLSSLSSRLSLLKFSRQISKYPKKCVSVILEHLVGGFVLCGVTVPAVFYFVP